MPDAATIALLAGQSAGGALRAIVDGGDEQKQADLVASIFEDTGHPVGHQVAEFMRTDPAAGFLFMQKAGGTGSVYNMVMQRKNADIKAQGATAATDALTSQARIYLQPPGGGGLPASAPSGAGAPAGPAAPPLGGDPGAIDLPTLTNALKQGADPGKLLTQLKQLRELSTTPNEADEYLKAAHIDPDQYTGPSVNAFIADGHKKAQPNYAGADRMPNFKLLVKRPPDQPPPSGYLWGRRVDGVPTQVAIQGGPADPSVIAANRKAEKPARYKAQVEDEYLKAVRSGGPVDPNLKAAFDEIVRMDPLKQLERKAFQDAGALPGSPQPGPTPAAGGGNDAARASARTELLSETGAEPTSAEIDARLAERGYGKFGR